MITTHRGRTVAFVLLAIVLVAAGALYTLHRPGSLLSPTSTVPSSGISTQALRNWVYRLGDGRTVQLKDGIGTVSAAGGSPASSVYLDDSFLADLDGNGTTYMVVDLSYGSPLVREVHVGLVTGSKFTMYLASQPALVRGDYLDTAAVNGSVVTFTVSGSQQRYQLGTNRAGQTDLVRVTTGTSATTTFQNSLGYSVTMPADWVRGTSGLASPVDTFTSPASLAKGGGSRLGETYPSDLTVRYEEFISHVNPDLFAARSTILGHDPDLGDMVQHLPYSSNFEQISLKGVKAYAVTLDYSQHPDNGSSGYAVYVQSGAKVYEMLFGNRMKASDLTPVEKAVRDSFRLTR